HQDDFAVSDFRSVEVFLRDARAERGDHGANFFVAKHLVVTRFFDIENFAFERQDRLKAPVATLFGGSACGFALDQEQFATLWLPFTAIRSFARQSATIKRAFAASKIAG